MLSSVYFPNITVWPVVSHYLLSPTRCSEKQSRDPVYKVNTDTFYLLLARRPLLFHIYPCRTVPLGVLQRIQCQQTRPCTLSHGIYHNWNSYPILYQLFHLCQFCPWVNFALHWFPSSWAICSNLCLITPSLIDEVLLPPTPLVLRWNRHRWYCKMWRYLMLYEAVTTQNHQK